MDKLFPVNPRAITGPPKMSVLLEANSMPALIIKPRFILVTHTDDLGWYIPSNQQGKMFIQNLNTIVRKPYVTPRQFLYCTTDSIPIDLMFKKTCLLPHKFGTVYQSVLQCLFFKLPCFLLVRWFFFLSYSVVF